MKKKIKKSYPYPSALISALAIVVIMLVFAVSIFTKPIAYAPAPQDGNAVLPNGSAVTIPKNQNQTAVIGQGQQLVTQEAGSIAAGNRVKFKIDNFKKLALQPLEFDIFDETGKALKPDDLKIVNQQRVHFVVVSANLKEFQHLYPSYSGGKWQILANLPNVGTYYAYTAIAPVTGNPVVMRSELVVQNPTTGSVTYPDVTPNLTVTTKTYTAQLTLKNATIYQQTALAFQLTRLGKAVPNLLPLLGENGRLIIFREGDPNSFMYLHALDTSDAKKALIQFVTTFPTAGRYVVFAEFKIGAQVYTFPLIFEVSAS